MNLKKLLSLACTLITLCALTSCGTSENSKEPILIKIGHTDSEARSTHKWSVWLGEYLEEKAPGKFIVEVYPEGQLGDTTELIEAVLDGEITMVFDLSAAVAAAAGPDAACIDLPYLYPSYEDWVAGVFENGGLALFNKSLEEYGYYCIDMYYNGMRQVISRRGIYHSTSALDGHKIRVAQNELSILKWQALGANPTPIPWGQVIKAMERGQIDALDHSLGVFYDFRIHDLAPYVTLTNHSCSPYPIITSQEWINSLPSEQRKILEEGVHEMARQQRDEEHQKEKEYIELIRSEGSVVEELTAAEVAEFTAAVQPVYDDWRAKAGDEVVDAWLGTVPKK